MSIGSSKFDLLGLIADRLRLLILDMAACAGGGHLGGSFSCLEILVTLYLGKVLKFNPHDPYWSGRDVLIFSKGHSCMAFYAVLSEAGFFEANLLKSYCQNGSAFAGHPEHSLVPGVEFTTGSLGHGLPIANGVALAAKLRKSGRRVYCVVGDGECNEGSVWEALMAANQLELDNLTLIIDYNKLESLDLVENILSIEPLVARLESFGWHVREVDGHNVEELYRAFTSPPILGSPTVIVAHTVKGNGVDFMEGVAKWHHRKITPSELADARSQIKKRLNDA